MKYGILWVLAGLLLAPVWAPAQQIELRPMENGPLRLSAIVSSGTRYFAGFVGTEDGATYLVPEGGKILQYRLKSIHETNQTALLVDADGDELLLVLTGDANAAALPEEERTELRTKTLEEFLAEHPELAAAAAEQEPIAFPAPTNTVTTYEDFLAANPELAGLSNYVAPELRGSSGEVAPTLSEPPVESSPVTREEGLRRMAEQAGLPIPEDQETTYEDFIRKHAPTAPGTP